MTGHLRILVLEGPDHGEDRAARSAALLFDVKLQLEKTRAKIGFALDFRLLSEAIEQVLEPGAGIRRAGWWGRSLPASF